MCRRLYSQTESMTHWSDSPSVSAVENGMTTTCSVYMCLFVWDAQATYGLKPVRSHLLIVTVMSIHMYACSVLPPCSSPLVPGAGCVLSVSILAYLLWYTLINVLCWDWRGGWGCQQEQLHRQRPSLDGREAAPTKPPKTHSNPSFVVHLGMKRSGWVFLALPVEVKQQFVSTWTASIKNNRKLNLCCDYIFLFLTDWPSSVQVTNDFTMTHSSWYCWKEECREISDTL